MIPGHIIRKMLNMVPVATLLGGWHYKESSGTGIYLFCKRH